MNIVNVGYRSTNYYVLADRQPRLLIDAGWPGTLATMQQTCRRMGVRLEAIPYQLITHYHPDHAGLAEELKGLGVRLLVAEVQQAAIPLLRRYVKPDVPYTPIQAAGNIVLPVADSRAFLAGIGIQGEILSTPGHSDDSISLVLDDGAAFTGDLQLPTSVAEAAAEKVRSSWAKLRARNVSMIYPGHGPARPIRSESDMPA
jgi:glyoxylase-like metal-dependent hydrolase (beta-lactamase superfamily II)